MSTEPVHEISFCPHCGNVLDEYKIVQSDLSSGLCYECSKSEFSITYIEIPPEIKHIPSNVFEARYVKRPR